jgi:ribosomal protein S18 acetylase RimI-like enzyme
MNISIAKSENLEQLSEFARFTYRVAYEEDVGKLRIDEHLSSNMSNSDFKVMMETDAFYLAFEQGNLIGNAQHGKVADEYAQFLTNFDSSASELRRLYVHPECHGKGIGNSLMQQVLKDPCIETKNVYLTTWQDNRVAQSLYKKHGFVKVGEIPEVGPDNAIAGYEHIMMKSVNSANDT